MGNISQETPMVAGPAKQGEDGCLIFAPGIVSGNTVPLALLAWEQGKDVYLILERPPSLYYFIPQSQAGLAT